MEKKTEFTADELMDKMNKRLKAAAAKTTKNKLASGEYVMHDGRPVPKSVVERGDEETDLELIVTFVTLARNGSYFKAEPLILEMLRRFPEYTREQIMARVRPAILKMKESE